MDSYPAAYLLSLRTTDAVIRTIRIAVSHPRVLLVVSYGTWNGVSYVTCTSTQTLSEGMLAVSYGLIR